MPLHKRSFMENVMRLSRNGIKVLSAQYRAILSKCLLINMAGFMAFSANAETLRVDSLDKVLKNENNKYDEILVSGGKKLSLDNSSLLLIKNDKLGKIEVNGGKLELLNGSSLNLSSDSIKDENRYSAIANFTDSEIIVNDSEMPIDGITTLKNSTLDISISENADSSLDNGQESYNLNLDKSIIIVDDRRNADDIDATLSVKNEFKSTNNSKIFLKNNAVFAWNGRVYEEDDDGNDVPVKIDGKMNIEKSEIELNNSAKILIGLDDNEGADEQQAKLNISDSKIVLKDSSSLKFHLKNKENTEIKNSNIQMRNDTEVSLNDLSMYKSHILMKDKSHLSLNNLNMEKSHITLNDDSSLDVENVKFDKGSSINGKNGKKNKIKFSGDVDFAGFFDPATADIVGTLVRGGYDDEISYNLNSGILKYTDDKLLYDKSTHTHNAGDTGRDNDTNAFADGKYALNSINFNGGTLDISNGASNEIKLSKLSLSKESNIILDADLANKIMDRFTDDTEVEGTAKLNISKLNLVSDAKNEKTVINFTKNEKLLSATNYVGAVNGLKALSPVYSYDVAYDNNSGNFTFTRNGGNNAEDYNPAVYAGSVIGHTIEFLQTNVANAAFYNFNQQLKTNQGLASGDISKSTNVWASAFGYDDTVDFKHFNSVDSKEFSIMGGVNSDISKTVFGDMIYGVYAGYINAKQKYEGNKIQQNGGYFGLGTKVQNHNAFVQAVINGGIIKNEDKHSFGNDKFDTYWTGIGAKIGYDYKLYASMYIQPNIYTGYTFVDNEDYTSKSGVRIKNDNLHQFEIAPGLKINKYFAHSWNGFVQAKYAVVMNNGGDIDVDNLALPNISAKNYVEYGVGAEKLLNDSWNISASINRRDGGREGWNGNINLKYNF